jgi:hypothetical protein
MTDTRIACTLDDEQLSGRLADIARLTDRALIDHEPLPSGARFRFRPEAERDLLALIAAESSCCSFLRFQLERREGELELTVEAPT